MLEELDILKTIKQIKPKQLLICTHTLDISLLENQFLSNFIRKYDTNCVIVTSETGLSESLESGVDLSGIGVDYALYTIRNYPYVFHPKIFLYVDQRDEINLFVGGTNFTYKGLCLNSDVVEFIEIKSLSSTSCDNLKIFLNSLSESIAQFEFTKFIDLFVGKCAHSDDLTIDKVFLSNIGISIFNQIKPLISLPVKKLRVISPYYDHDMTALRKIREELGAIHTEIMLNHNSTEVDLLKIPQDVKIYTNNNDRFLHAKILIIYSENGASILVGSANCTFPGLISINQKGNWETAIFNRNVDIGFANNLWNSYIPKKLSENNRWKYVPLNVSRNLFNKVFFTASLLGKNLEIEVISFGFRDTIEVSIQGLSIDGICLTRNQTIQYKCKFNFLLDDAEFQAIQAKPVKIEMRTRGDIIGRNWLIQYNELRKSKSQKNFERMFSQIITDPFSDVDRFIEITEFLIKHLVLFGGMPRNETNLIRIQSSNKIKNSIQTIYQIIEADSFEETKYGSFTAYELHDLGKIIRNVLSKEIDSYLPVRYDELLEEDDEPTIVNHNHDRTPTSSRLELNNVLYEPTERDKRILLYRLPRFEDIFKTQIIDRFNTDVLKGSLPPDEQFLRFESLMDILLQSYDYIEFFRVRLPKGLRLVEMDEQYRFFMRESATLFWWFWDEVYTYFRNHFKDKLENILENKHYFLQKCVDLICIYWVSNYNHLNLRGNEHLAILVSQTQTKHYFDSALTESNPKRGYFCYNSLSSTTNDISYFCENIMEDIKLYQERKNDKGESISNVLRYHFWENAKCYHDNALKTLQSKGSENIQLVSDHERKRGLSENKMEKLKSAGTEILGNMFDSRLFNRKEIFSASEICNKLSEFVCPRKTCNYILSPDTFITLNRFEYFECPNCSALLLPVNIDDEYRPRDVSETEWN